MNQDSEYYSCIKCGNSYEWHEMIESGKLFICPCGGELYKIKDENKKRD